MPEVLKILIQLSAIIITVIRRMPVLQLIVVRGPTGLRQQVLGISHY